MARKGANEEVGQARRISESKGQGVGGAGFPGGRKAIQLRQSPLFVIRSLCCIVEIL